MIKIRIHGIKDGQHEIKMSVPVEEIDEMFPEFFGNIDLEGKLRKIGNRFSFVGQAKCQAKLVCDLSLEEYTELIETEINVSFLADTTLFMLHGDKEVAEFEEKIVHEDDEYYDISYEVNEALAVQLPMKRIAPEYREKNLEDIYPFVVDKQEEKQEEPVDDRWAALKKLKFN